MRTLVVFLIGLGVVYGQSDPAFEVVSIKRSPPYEPGMPAGMRADPTHIIAQQIPIRTLILGAYNVELWQIVGAPDWTRDEGYDVSVTIPVGTTKATEELMMQRLLAERCKLVVHRETKDSPVYELVVAKGGSKLKVSTDEQYGVRRALGHLEVHHASIANFTRSLNEPSDRPILDKTDIKGLYDFTLDWTPEARAGADGPSIFTAMEEQLGLRLESRREPLEYVVIDHVERPSEN
jgi:uncharacterized protein (TIGR03435 family)